MLLATLAQTHWPRESIACPSSYRRSVDINNSIQIFPHMRENPDMPLDSCPEGGSAAEIITWVVMPLPQASSITMNTT